MNNTEKKTTALLDSRATWITLWALALVSLLFSLRALSLVMPKTCVTLCIVSFLLCAAGTLTGICVSKTRLEVNEAYVYCKTFTGKELYMPLNSVTGIKCGCFDTVCIYSPSFKIKCCFVKNKRDIISSVKSGFSKTDF